MKVEYEILPTSTLKHFVIRDIRQGVVDELVERFEKGYNPSKPLTVVKKDGELLVANGNHRLRALNEAGIDEVPCVIYTDADPYKLAVEGNADEDTYSPMDLFDWIGLIGKMRSEGLTQQEIGERVNWSRATVSNYSMLIERIATPIIDLAKLHQKERVAISATNVATFNFTEGWFRNLYGLSEKYQERLINDFIQDKCNWNNNKVKSEAAKYKRWQEFIQTAESRLVNQDDLDELVELIELNVFKTDEQLLFKIKDFNSKAENKLINGDSVAEMENLEDSSIDLVITDPPYGIGYSSNRSKYSETVTKEKIDNDSELSSTLELLDDALEVLNRKTKDDAHLYIFTSWKVYPEFKQVIEQYFDIKNMIVWDKGNHGAGDLQGAWGNRHELIIFASKGNRSMNTRKADIINVSKLSTTNMIHPTQKPVDVITELLRVSAHTKDTVIDPFMGSGSTIKAVKEYGDLNYIGIELDEERFKKATEFIGG